MQSHSFVAYFVYFLFVYFSVPCFWFDVRQVIGSLQQLVFFDVSKNCIENIAAEIENCSSLTDIHLSSNRLQHLPESLGTSVAHYCTSLKLFWWWWAVWLTLRLAGMCHLHFISAKTNLSFINRNSSSLCVTNCLTFVSLVLRFYVNVVVLGRLSNLTTLKLNDNCLLSLPFSIGGSVPPRHFFIEAAHFHQISC